MSRKRFDHPNVFFGGFHQDNDIEGFGKMFKGFFAVWLVWALFCLALVIGVLYVAVHFLAKVW